MSEVQISGRCGADPSAGAALLAAALLAVLAMAHHPANADAGAIGGIVHGAMIALAALLAFGFAHFSLRRGLDRPTILAGLIAYGTSLFAHIGAATINGFAVPALAAREGVGHDLFQFAWELNQALADLGAFATSAAYVLWSFDFLGRPGRETRAIGLAGLLAGTVPAVLLATGFLRMDLSGAMTVYAVQAAWAALVGLHVARSRLDAQ